MAPAGVCVQVCLSCMSGERLKAVADLMQQNMAVQAHLSLASHMITTSHSLTCTLLSRRGGTYLIDPTSGLIYNDAHLDEWPQLLGLVDANSQTVMGMGMDAATSFFVQLNAYLREEKVREYVRQHLC